ncbi:MAG: transcriptional regulator NrdR [Verrucomicrobiota bacterium JB022]|nr:transcriptional regulator NrdR [Verrucomicrobiota bacterium JB022]
MICPRCQAGDTRVIDSRLARNGQAIRRRRQCNACGYRFTTAEEHVRDELWVKKNDGRREPFESGKILNGLRRACEKRPIDPEQLRMIVGDVTAEMEASYDSEIPARDIGEAIMKRLKTIDQIAYVRFASVYKEFRDIDELAQEISALRREARPASSEARLG